MGLYCNQLVSLCPVKLKRRHLFTFSIVSCIITIAFTGANGREFDREWLRIKIFFCRPHLFLSLIVANCMFWSVQPNAESPYSWGHLYQKICNLWHQSQVQPRQHKFSHRDWWPKQRHFPGKDPSASLQQITPAWDWMRFTENIKIADVFFIVLTQCALRLSVTALSLTSPLTVLILLYGNKFIAAVDSMEQSKEAVNNAGNKIFWT